MEFQKFLIGDNHMSDVHDKTTRSKNMSAIRGKGNKSTELKFLKLLKNNKITGWIRHYKYAPGTPDFVFRKQRISVFIDGCYWHKCPDCFITPKSNTEFWMNKINANVDRDIRNDILSLKKKWKVFRVRECKLKNGSEHIIDKLNENLNE